MRHGDNRTGNSAARIYGACLGGAAVLTRAEQDALVPRAQAHDSRAKARLVAANMRLVVHIVRSYRPHARDIEDLVAAGNVGLVEAVARYDQRRGVAFTSYAAYWIRARVLESIMGRTVVHAGSRAMRRLFWRLARVRRELETAGEVPVRALIAHHSGVTEEDVERLAPLIENAALSLDAPLPTHAHGSRMRDEAADPEAICIRDQLERRVALLARTFRATLGPRDCTVWDRRLYADEGELLSTLGHELGVTKERVRQIEAGLKRRLRDWVVAREPDIAAV